MPDSHDNLLDTSVDVLRSSRARIFASSTCQAESRQLLNATYDAIADTQDMIRSTDVFLYDYGTLRHRPE
jgi:hypothetical protein